MQVRLLDGECCTLRDELISWYVAHVLVRDQQVSIATFILHGSKQARPCLGYDANPACDEDRSALTGFDPNVGDGDLFKARSATAVYCIDARSCHATKSVSPSVYRSDVIKLTFLSESKFVAHGGCMLSKSTKGMASDMPSLVCQSCQQCAICASQA